MLRVCAGAVMENLEKSLNLNDWFPSLEKSWRCLKIGKVMKKWRNDGRLATFTYSPQVYKLAPLQSRHINANLPQIHTRPTFSCNVLWVSLSEGSMILAINIISCFSAQHVLACEPSSAPFDEREALSTGALDLSASIDCGVVFWHESREP